MRRQRTINLSVTQSVYCRVWLIRMTYGDFCFKRNAVIYIEEISFKEKLTVLFPRTPWSHENPHLGSSIELTVIFTALLDGSHECPAKSLIGSNAVNVVGLGDLQQHQSHNVLCLLVLVCVRWKWLPELSLGLSSSLKRILEQESACQSTTFYFKFEKTLTQNLAHLQD